MYVFRDNEVLWQADRTSSWFPCLGALHAILHDGFWKSDHDFMIAFHSNFLSAMHGFRDNVVLFQAGYDVIVISLPVGASRYFTWRILKEQPDFLIAFFSNVYLGCMPSRITRFCCKPDMTSSWFLRQGAFHANLHDGFWKSDHDFLIAFHSNFLSVIYGFRDNVVLFQAGCDVIVISPPRDAARNFWLPILKGWPRFYISVAL